MQNSLSSFASSSSSDNTGSLQSTIEAASAAALAARLERERKGKEKKLRKAMAKGQLSDITMNRLVSELGTKTNDIYNLMMMNPTSNTNTSSKSIDSKETNLAVAASSSSVARTASSSSLTSSSSFASSSSSLMELTFRETLPNCNHHHHSNSSSSLTPSTATPGILLRPESIQHLLLWLLGGQMEKPNWISSKNKGLINNIVLVFIRDLSWSELSSSLSTISNGSIASSSLPFLSSLPMRKIKYPRFVWNPWYRVIHLMDHKILYLPKNAIVVDDNAKLYLTDSDDEDDSKDAKEKEEEENNDTHPRTGDKRKRNNPDSKTNASTSTKKTKTTKNDENMDNGSGTSDDDDDDDDSNAEANEPYSEENLAVQRRKRLFELSLSIHELLEHKFALALPKGDTSVPTPTIETSTSTTPNSPWRSSPGRIAGVPPEICKLCTLHIPAGHILTRTAHYDIHHAYSDHTLRSCPVFHFYQYIDSTHPLSGSTDSLTTTNSSTSSTLMLTTHPGNSTLTTSRTIHQTTTKTTSSTAPSSPLAPIPVYGLDCEMCETKEGRFQLARATVVDSPLTSVINDATSDRSSYMNVLFDELVQPEESILDYKTKYSGITKEILDTAKYDILYVQDKLADIFDGIVTKATAVSSSSSSNKKKGGKDDKVMPTTGLSTATAVTVPLQPAFIVGHSIDNDLKSIRIIHTRIIDTSLIFPHPSGLPRRYSLRQLALLHLGRSIQDSEYGHDSTEDAMTTLHLAHTLIEEDDEDYTFDPDDNDDDDDNKGKGKDTVLDINELLFSFFFHRPLRPGIELPSITSNTTTYDYYSKGLANTLRLLNPSFSTNSSNNTDIDASSSSVTTDKDKYQPITDQRYAITDKNSTTATRHILALPDMMNKEKINNITIIGSPAFVSTNVCGSASGIPTGHNPITSAQRNTFSSSTAPVHPVNNTVGEARRLTDIIVHQSDKIATARKEGKYSFTSISFTVAEIHCPTNPSTDNSHSKPNHNTKKNSKVLNANVPTLSRFEALDQVLGGLCSKLAVGTAVVMVTQASRLRYGVQNLHASSSVSSSSSSSSSSVVTTEDTANVENNNSSKRKKRKEDSEHLDTGRMKKTEAAAAIDAQYGAVLLHVVNPSSSTKMEAKYWKAET